MSLARLSRLLALPALALSALAVAHSPAKAYPPYAAKEKVSCAYCHTNQAGGGARNFRGVYYKAHDLSFASFDEVFEAKAAGVKPDSKGEDSKATVDSYPEVKVAPALNFVVKNIDGKTVNLGRYEGDVIMVVNVASLCGNTPQYASLQKIYDKYKAKGFTILAFPANDFMKQEPGDNAKIKAFCTDTYKVTFPMFSKIVVKGDNQAPLYKYLTDKKTDPKFGGDIDWNFAKFLINRQGEVVARFPAGTDPLKPAVISAVEKELEVPKTDKTARL